MGVNPKWTGLQMPGHSTEIANEFLKRAEKEGVHLTPMQLQKLVYLAHGWSLAVLKERLVTDSAEAWSYGPVFRDLYRALRQYGPESVTRLIRQKDFISLPSDDEDVTVSANLSEPESTVIDEVFKVYGRMPAYKLSALTHESDTPWAKVYETGGKSSPIANNMIQEYFVQLGQSGEEPQ